LKKQFILIISSIILVLAVFFFGRTTPAKKEPSAAEKPKGIVKLFDIEQFKNTEKAKLSPEKAIAVSKLENNITRGDILAENIKANEALANFWKDSAKCFELYAFYTSATSKLVNSEKNLTFAARIFLDNLREEKDISKLNWETDQAIDLFERAIKINPTNDDLKVGLGSCYVFGKGQDGNPQETMKGILQLLDVVKKDSTNMKAQLVLGIGGLKSAQYEKAIPRFEKVVQAQPNNVEAVTFLADAYGAVGRKEEAIKYYNISKKLINNVEFSKEVDEHIKQMK
jgi:tetratricopeptide (TPR) repeat protein